MNFLYKWLPICFGCHCRSDRSFHWKNRQFPICARCTGELIGIIAGLVVASIAKIDNYFSFLIMMPMLIDGFCQLLTRYESTNRRRLFTGFLFGFGLGALYLSSVAFVFQLGQMTAQYWS